MPGIDDFGTVLMQDIINALPFLKQQGVPYYLHAEIPDNTTFQAILLLKRNHCKISVVTIFFLAQMQLTQSQ